MALLQCPKKDKHVNYHLNVHSKGGSHRIVPNEGAMYRKGPDLTLFLQNNHTVF